MSGPAWWQRGAIYQIYPRSFADADGDGVGDLRGIAARLDHVSDLGAEAVWLSPIFRSPMADFGYDVADYCDVDPVFGTLADFDRLVADAHARGIRVVLDFVPNHSSDRHPWFQASRSSREDPRRDWYVWRDGAGDGRPPNDWRSRFEAVGPAWTFDERTGQWYLHSFTPQQPDLNWDNPEVEAAMHAVLRFWLDRGVDGFRLDAIPVIAKDPELRDAGDAPTGPSGPEDVDAPRRRDQDWDTIHDRLRGIRRVVDEYADRMLVGEVYLFDLQRIVSYVAGADQLHLAHNFVFVLLPWDAERFRSAIDGFEAAAAGTAWPAWFLENHDSARVATRFDEDGHGPARARAAAVMLYALRGTPFVYQGQELGLPDAAIAPERVVDVDGRDPQRAPLPWRPPSLAGPGAGFTSGEPWLPLVADAERLNVESQAADPRSTLSLVRRLAALRAATPALQTGAQRTLDAPAGVLAWVRDGDGQRLVVAVNFSTAPVPLGAVGRGATLVLSSDPDRAEGEADGEALVLGPSEAVVLRSVCQTEP
jgi:alpha-glucosidase